MLRNVISFGSKYIPAYSTKTLISSRRDDSFSKLLSKKYNSVQEWRMLRENLINTSKYVSINTVDSMIVNFCINHGQYEQAKQYVNFMQEEKIKFNLASLGKCFKLHYILHLEGLSTQEDEENIVSMYKKICEEYSILDSISSENIVLGLSVTTYWKECFKLLNDIKISGIPNGAAYNAIICAAFFHDDYDTGWLLFQEMIENNRSPLNSIYLTYLDKIAKLDYKTKCQKLDDLLEFSSFNGLQFDEEIANKIIDITNDKSTFTIITKNGNCKTCTKKLQLLNLSTEEFEDLKKAFFDNVIVGRDIFCKSTPDELERFKSFVKNMDKFDVVVDGLNVAYSTGVKQPPYVHSMLLAAVVQHFTKRRKKVLVMGRTHMEKLPQKNWNFIKKHSTLFLTQNISQDDPYILYCSLHCGINTIIVTRDFMRSHLFLLKHKQHKLLFHRWLTQNRYHLLHADSNGVFFKEPLPYLVSPQKDKNHWHVPYIVENSASTTPICKWLCIEM